MQRYEMRQAPGRADPRKASNACTQTLAHPLAPGLRFSHSCRIDANIEEADINVNEAQKQLLKYMQSMGSNRWLMLRVFAVVIVLFVAFVIFAA